MIDNINCEEYEKFVAYAKKLKVELKWNDFILPGDVFITMDDNNQMVWYICNTIQDDLIIEASSSEHFYKNKCCKVDVSWEFFQTYFGDNVPQIFLSRNEQKGIDIVDEIKNGYYYIETKLSEEPPSDETFIKMLLNSTKSEEEIAKEIVNFRECVNKFKELNHGFYQLQEKAYLIFKKDALERVGLINHPESDKAFQMALKYGQSELYEVFAVLTDISEVILGKNKNG